MNEVINVLENHRSIRSYLEKDIPKDIILEILTSAQDAPNSINGQQTSVIVIRDKDTKRKLAELAGGQPWIEKAPVFLIFVMDFYKTEVAVKKAGKVQIIEESAEGLLAGAVDAGILLGTTVAAAESLGLGTVCIGGIRNSPEEIIKLLNLPKKTFPLVGLALGYPADNSRKKPRLPLDTFIHEEKYNPEKIVEEIDGYDKLMDKYLIEIGREQEKNWSDFVSQYYSKVYFPKVYPILKEQGFKMDK
ncbi:MAG: NADPH-dependent oxidoreductase [Cetobacterium sp.]|uniref:NADPH-dependent oxidoreductase n=1 Tax=unclassified Cetobacterium TaxID=2630983 RepID=UPI00163C6BBE|nr:NADPH-dependent oxidoreductase [Cetobacterium sp. 2A]MBC2855222.1 NADPH-dependent oxidoreductase [Cetobacterium sp. 2A]MBC2855271.1 NADPH-dependent oxidoreductase [Cetobacterium sp. 2A]MBC2855643.1 NADPH-dependent oxidoreductase [Cetobacterium sp. 2A]